MHTINKPSIDQAVLEAVKARRLQGKSSSHDGNAQEKTLPVIFVDTKMLRVSLYCLVASLLVARWYWVQGGGRLEPDPTALRHRSTQAKVVGTVSKLRWIDAGTDKPSKVYFSEFLVNGEQTWIERDDFNANLTLEALTENGPVGSVRFELFGSLNRLENFAPWAMCGNAGPDFSPCPVLTQSGDLIVTPYSERYGRGVAGESLYALIIVYTAQDCDLFFRGINADTDQVGDVRIDGGSNYVVNVTSTPRINFLLDWELRTRCWEPHSVSFSYNDNGVKTTFDDKRPFSAFGDKVTTLGSTDYLPLSPTIGTHTLNATIFKRASLVGATLSLTITVVK
jgi:hypothetical protein